MSTRRARVGEAVGLDWGQAGHVDSIVQPPCEGNTGQHKCVLHPDAYPRSNWEMNDHLAESSEHVEVWLCPEHGPESTHPDDSRTPEIAAER